jgi:hypothetical protein
MVCRRNIDADLVQIVIFQCCCMLVVDGRAEHGAFRRASRVVSRVGWRAAGLAFFRAVFLTVGGLQVFAAGVVRCRRCGAGSRRLQGPIPSGFEERFAFSRSGWCSHA